MAKQVFRWTSGTGCGIWLRKLRGTRLRSNLTAEGWFRLEAGDRLAHARDLPIGLPMSEETAEQRAERFAATLNRHGHPFQYRVLAELKPLQDSGWTVWNLEAAEFPVSTDDGGTRTDFVLWAHGTAWWMIGECKRVNPAFGEWFFLRAPYIRRMHQEGFVAEVATQQEGLFQSGGMVVDHSLWGNYYHIGMDVKTNRPGDPSGGGQRSAIEEAASQVCRALNGMIVHLSRRPGAMGPKRVRGLIPVIFTTAKLYASDVDLSHADLLSGTVRPSALNLAEQPYVFYQYHQSPGITHGAVPRREFHELPAALITDYVRTIPIVTAASARDFFQRFDPSRFIPRELEWLSADEFAKWTQGQKG